MRVFCLVLALMWGCSGEEESEFEVLHVRDLSVGSHVSESDIHGLVQGNSRFAFELYHALAPSGDLVFSPLSVSRAFSNYYKTDGLFYDQFRAVFGYPADSEVTEHAFRVLSARLIRGKGGESPTWFDSQDIYWVQSDQAESSDVESFRNFDRVHALDFQNPDRALYVINDWILDYSRGLLPEFLTPADITVDTVGVTTNVMFFKGTWQEKFAKRDIRFVSEEGAAPAVLAALGATAEFGFYEEPGYKAVRLPYTQGYSLLAVMPQDFAAFSASVDAQLFSEVVASLRSRRVDVTVPQIPTSSEPDIVGGITQLRHRAGFSDLSPLTGAHQETYVHKAVIKVDHEGTAATAGTVIIEYNNNAPDLEEPVALRLDRPFMYAIMDDESGSILFLGQFTGR